MVADHTRRPPGEKGRDITVPMAGRQRWRWVLVGVALVLIPCGVVGRWAAVDRRLAHGYQAVRPGDTRDRVRQILGTPDQTVSGRYALGEATWDGVPVDATVVEQDQWLWRPDVYVPRVYGVGYDRNGRVVARHNAD